MPFPRDPNAPGGPGRSEFLRSTFRGSGGVADRLGLDRLALTHEAAGRALVGLRRGLVRCDAAAGLDGERRAGGAGGDRGQRPLRALRLDPERTVR
jgi:hypothetical protein